MATDLIKKINPQGINDQQGAINAIGQLQSIGMPDSIFNQVNRYINSPITKKALDWAGINQNEFTNQLHAVLGKRITPLTSKSSPLLQGIDQLK